MKNEYEYEDCLTNQQLLKRFKNQFELVRYAMQLAENAIKSGREMDVDSDSQNVAFQVLAEIYNNKERFEEIPAARIEEEKAAFDKKNANNRQFDNSFSKGGKDGKKEKRAKSNRLG
jgi:DNA-directed RNA polymerase